MGPSRVRSWVRRCGAAIFALALALPCSVALAANGDCGIPLSTGSAPKTNDCLFILRAGVGAETCAGCVCDINGNLQVSATDALLCLSIAVGQDIALACPDCPVTTTLPETTTTTLPLPDGCPDIVQWETRGQRSSACTTNDDCAVGDCDSAVGLCRTATDYDLGWTGLGHDGDLNEGSRLRVRVDCEATDAPCGECTVEGMEPSAGNCRCSNDTRIKCDEPFGPDADDCPACGGGFRVNGITCGANADCQLAPCARRCANNAAICSSNTDCPGSTCGNPARCQNNTAVTCTTNTDCPGSTCLPAVTTCGNRLSCTANADCTGTCAAASDCECFDGPPMPLSIGGTPLCFVHRLAADVSGTVDVDSGASSLAVSMRVGVYLGATTTSPCPICGGRCSNDAGALCITDDDCEQGGTCTLDPEAGDGNAGGFCVGGGSNGLSCDVDAANTSFPARPGERGGAGYSLDCLPDVGKNVTGQGLAVHFVEATGSSELAAEVSCSGAYSAFSCPCLVCSGDPGVACNSHEECAVFEGNCSLGATLRCLSNSDCQDLDVGPCITVGAQKRCSKKTSKICLSDEECLGEAAGDCNPSMCSSSSNGMSAPNQCTDLECSDIGGGTGECATGPDALFCNGIVKANGVGVLACTQDDDCAPGVVGVDAGQCDLAIRQGCFLDTIDATGSAHPSQPVTAAAFCMPTTSGGGRNAVIGLPGPARIRRQSTLVSWCGSNPGNIYTPGSGGCVP